MNFEAQEKIANAVLYEGFLLYPYRRSSTKNQQRWHFGTLGPQGGADPSEMRTECLIEKQDNQPVVYAKVRFLEDDIERELVFTQLRPEVEDGEEQRRRFSFGTLTGLVEWRWALAAGNLYRLTIRIQNTSEKALMLSTHTLLGSKSGAFVSLLDPPEAFRKAAATCKNIGTWPVLVGREGERDRMLSSPIILYDYPQIAPESHGDFFDGTEMDEMLTLRVLTLSDEEKREVREGDPKGREILERTEMLPAEQLAKLHGAIRNLRNSTKLAFREGDRVRLRPKKKADIFDIALDGKIAIVEAVEHDFEDHIHLAVTVEDDPGREFGVMRQIGHRFFFSPEEVELL